MNDYNTNGFELQLTPEFIADYQKLIKKGQISNQKIHQSLRTSK